ncbi:LuxR family two component transcriptional regulator [Dokdonia sp. Hel_I_63]|jgi:DNA-binding NarL/FixJ family response regulator|uniref:response regulator transcription factor n=1 Tax=unclassified Dokdonia TaxID=2615033 RepID=UPI00020A74C9|nr:MULTISPECIES: response regulator transcription factor [unclassified Dokdonia]AEE18689.1 two component transcriptional regulator, LuxR family [Dokdonia sp. 4H-3-7-5]TVZ22082.1 LuxR family two component transcriptional regulator [Dokdonia sp. Hel_I_63]
MKTIVIVDDHTLLSQAISGLVNSFDNFEVLYTCKNGQELLDNLRFENKRPDIILMDVNMPIMDGIEATAQVKELYPTILILALSVEEDDHTILQMIRAGAKGYLLKDTEKKTLENALNELALNGYYHTNTVSQLLVKSLNGNNKDALRDREIEFIKHACTEMTYNEIADVMFLSPKTVQGYRDSVFSKLNLKNRTGLVIYALKNGLFRP